ncbi:MAG: hypothetical protein CMI24_00885 [Opitutae bacterium]|nr:hypothetical protein [Opitutae bacterium]MEC8421009.1 trypsin-like peptidase domain-containing protein [Verrucomicrobiota bacterium]
MNQIKNRLSYIHFSLVLLSFQSNLLSKKLDQNPNLFEVYEAIVRVEVISEKGAGGRMMKSRSTGSGVIISNEGLIITNHHVAGNANRLSCRLHNGEEIMADLLGADAMTDLAVLKLRLDENNSNENLFQTATFGNSDKVEIGDICYAMGSPAGLSQSITRGIISNLAMISPFRTSFRLDGENVGELVRWLGHDAVIFPGNSGGPLVNQKGEIIGINEVGIGSLGGAIPSNLAKEVAAELTANGFVSRSWTGIECQPLIDPQGEGILVSGIIDGSPAQDAGLLPGDIIMIYAGKEVNAKIPEDIPIFNQLAYGIKPGTEVKIVGTRKGKKKSWILKTDNREAAFAKEIEIRSWGITVRDFTRMSALENRRSDRNGVQVHTVGRGGPSYSAKPSLLPGDVIVRIGSKKIGCIQELVDESRKITLNQKKPVPKIVHFERNQAQLLTVVKIGPEPDESQPLEAWKPWLGLSTQVLTQELREALDVPLKFKGVRVTQVYPDTPAKKGGIKPGDLLFRIDGQIIAASRPEDSEVFGNMIKQYRTDASIRIEGFRENKPLSLKINLSKRPPPKNELPKLKDKTFEFTVREIAFSDRVRERLDNNSSGLIVENVEPAGWAALAGLQQGDLLLEVDGKSLGSVLQFSKILQKLILERAQRITVFVRRGIHTLFLELQPDWDNSKI